jgi:hypothetical protein
MPIKPPSEFIQCADPTSCFQSIYNFLFAILIALAFIYFLYGALQYLLSAAGVFPKEEGKKKMINSIIAVIVALVIPIFLNMINPGIFQVKLQVPKVDATLPNYKGEDIYAPSPAEVKPGFVKVETIIRQNRLQNISTAHNVQVNESLVSSIKSLDSALQKRGIRATITSGYSPKHDSLCHTKYGTCIDIIVSHSIEPCEQWQKLGAALKDAGFSTIIYETKAISSVKKCEFLQQKNNCGIQWKQCPQTTGPHIHAVK